MDMPLMAVSMANSAHVITKSLSPPITSV
jgi:hypothetical protein